MFSSFKNVVIHLIVNPKNIVVKTTFIDQNEKWCNHNEVSSMDNSNKPFFDQVYLNILQI